PDTSRTRVFPKMSQVLSNTYAPGESLSNINRTLNFILTVRDLYQGWGGFNASFDTDTVKVQVQQTSVRFAVTSQSTPEFWFAGDYQQVSWTTAGTQLAPFNTSYVDILLSVDGGLTFPIVLAENMPNNGSAWVMAPFLDEMTTTARIKVKAVGNIFFQVNQAPITAMGGIALPVEDLNFRAESLACTAALRWTNKGENSWLRFDLQR